MKWEIKGVRGQAGAELWDGTGGDEARVSQLKWAS